MLSFNVSNQRFYVLKISLILCTWLIPNSKWEWKLFENYVQGICVTDRKWRTFWGDFIYATIFRIISPDIFKAKVLSTLSI